MALRAAILVLCVLAGCSTDEPEFRRNIVIIVTDDQRYDAMGFLNPFFETPRIDELAQAGIVFEQAFVTTAVCAPSRASILSGQWTNVHGVLNNEYEFDPATPTFPQLLQAAGYETAFIGKWHLGTGAEPRPGFDYWVSYDGQGVYFDQTFNVNGAVVQTQGHNTERTTDFAVEFLNRPRENPFLLFVSHKAVHAGFRPAEKYEGSYDGREFPKPSTFDETPQTDGGKPRWVDAQRESWLGARGRYSGEGEFNAFARRYAETVRTVDESVGRILDALKALEMFDSTLVMFTSDNGFMMGEHGLLAKRTMYEESMRVPMLVSCPELFEAGQRREQMVLNTDIGPTLLEAAGVAIPEYMQGESFWGLLTDADAPWRDAFLYQYYWEDAYPQTPTTVGLRTERYKFIRYLGVFDRAELYDLAEDPHETKNLIAEYFTPGTRETMLAKFYNGSAPEELSELVVSLNGRLNEELARLGQVQTSGVGLSDVEQE